MHTCRLVRGVSRHVARCVASCPSSGRHATNASISIFSTKAVKSNLWGSSRYFHQSLGAHTLQSISLQDLPEMTEAATAIQDRKFAKAETLLKRCAEILTYIPEPDRSNRAADIGYLLAESYFGANKFLEAFKAFDNQVVPVILKKLTFSDDDIQMLKHACTSYIRAEKLDETLALVAKILPKLGSSNQVAKLQFLRYQSIAAMLIPGGVPPSVSEHIKPTQNASNIYKIALVELLTTVIRAMMRDVEVTEVAELKAKYLEPLNKLSGLNEAEQKYCDIVKSDVCLALAEIEMKKSQYTAAEEYLITSIDLTDKVFNRHSHRVRHVLEKISISQINLKKFFFAEGLFRRLEEWYEKMPADRATETSIECLKSFSKMLRIQKRDTEADRIDARVAACTTIVKDPLFDVELLTWDTAKL